MYRIMLKSKIHRATVTGTVLEYEGSIAIDPLLLTQSGILPNEQVHVLNLNTGGRIETYVIKGKAGTGEICLNGPAARSAQPGDKIIILSYALVSDDEAHKHKPVILVVNNKNKVIRKK
ncbi:MAG: aspartate 1-decarboxylase [Elusimicrobiota bacterium]